MNDTAQIPTYQFATFSQQHSDDFLVRATHGVGIVFISGRLCVGWSMTPQGSDGEYDRQNMGEELC